MRGCIERRERVVVRERKGEDKKKGGERRERKGSVGESKAGDGLGE